MNKTNAIMKIDCQLIKLWLKSIYNQDKGARQCVIYTKMQELLQRKNRTLNNKSKHDLASYNNVALDIRTYICAKGKCKLYNNRQHRRISNYNYNKMTNAYPEISNSLDNITNEIINTWEQKTGNGNPNIKYIKFIKGTTNERDAKIYSNRERYKPIETVFDKIDEMAEENNKKTSKKKAMDAPGQHINNSANNRMTYGDINYLGSNKAIFYFDRGIRGKQIFTNTMRSLKTQPSYNDIVVIDDIVFTSTCKCDSANQHKKMFPHYRVTCAVGLTCPARLNSYERIAYARSKNATSERFTTARSMLVRNW